MAEKDLVKIEVGSTDPKTKKTTKAAYSGTAAMIVAFGDNGSHTHITGKVTAPDLLSMMFILSERVEKMLIEDFGYEPHTDIGIILTKVKQEMINEVSKVSTHH